MELKIAICDDEQAAINQIDHYLQQIEKETKLRFQKFYFSSGEELIQYVPRDIQVLMLDIQMSEISGIDAAKKLRAEGLDFFLLFVTSNTQYALEGYSVHAYEFLCKPIRYAQLKRCLLDVSERIQKSRPVLLTIKSGKDSHIVDFNHVIYAEVYGHTSIIIIDDGTRMTTGIPLDQLERKLNSHGFFRCHKSYLINVNRIQSIQTSQIIMSDKSQIPLSRYRKKEFLLFFNEILGNLP